MRMTRLFPLYGSLSRNLRVPLATPRSGYSYPTEANDMSDEVAAKTRGRVGIIAHVAHNKTSLTAAITKVLSEHPEVVQPRYVDYAFGEFASVNTLKPSKRRLKLRKPAEGG